LPGRQRPKAPPGWLLPTSGQAASVSELVEGGRWYARVFDQRYRWLGEAGDGESVGVETFSVDRVRHVHAEVHVVGDDSGDVAVDAGVPGGADGQDRESAVLDDGRGLGGYL